MPVPPVPPVTAWPPAWLQSAVEADAVAAPSITAAAPIELPQADPVQRPTLGESFAALVPITEAHAGSTRTVCESPGLAHADRWWIAPAAQRWINNTPLGVRRLTKPFQPNMEQHDREQTNPAILADSTGPARHACVIGRVLVQATDQAKAQGPAGCRRNAGCPASDQGAGT